MAKFGKDPIYRTKVIVWKSVWMPARHTQSHNTASLETGVYKLQSWRYTPINTIFKWSSELLNTLYMYFELLLQTVLFILLTWMQLQMYKIDLLHHC